MIGEILGAGASLIGGLLGSSAEQQAAQMNYNIALMNYYAQQQQFQAAQAEAAKQDREGKLGTTDAAGNRTHFEPGVGWVTDLSPQQKQLQDMYQGEEVTQLAQDIPVKRRQMMENVARSQKESGYASALFDAMQRQRPQNPQDIIGQRNLLSAEGINQGTRPAIETATRNALRSGNTAGAADIASRIGVSQGEQLRKAFMENEQGARQQSQSDYGTAQSNLANMYSAFAKNASAMPDAPYNPRNIAGDPNASRMGAAASGALLNTMGREAPDLKYTQPVEYGMGNTFSQLGNNLLGMDQGYAANRYRQQAVGDYYNYANSNPSSSGMYRAGTNNFG